jgi:hypothetical protein
VLLDIDIDVFDTTVESESNENPPALNTYGCKTMLIPPPLTMLLAGMPAVNDTALHDVISLKRMTKLQLEIIEGEENKTELIPPLLREYACTPNVTEMAPPFASA